MVSRIRKRVEAHRARLRAAALETNSPVLQAELLTSGPFCASSSRSQRGFSLIELLIVIGIILVILSIALPQMGKSQMHAHEMAAIKTVQTINSVQVQYQSTFGQYASALSQLGPPAGSGGTEGAQAANLISQNLAGGSASGYTFTVTQTPSGYAVVATPKAYNNTGRRSFYSDQTGIIRENATPEPASANSPEIK